MDAYHQMRASTPGEQLYPFSELRTSHGALRDDPPLLDSSSSNCSSSTHSDAPYAVRTARHGDSVSAHPHHHRRQKGGGDASATGTTNDTSASNHLRGSPRPFTTYFLAKGFACNSYFAKRVRLSMYLVTLLAFGGVSSFWMDDDKPLEEGGLYVRDITTSLWFERQECKSDNNTHSTSCSSCRTLVVYAMLEYHLLPFAVLIGLPATGIRPFEPFKRRSGKVTRSLYLQFCEVLCTAILVLHFLVAIYFGYSFLMGYNFECADARVHLYVIGATLAFVGVLVEMTYFARFREHVKMQLGAFREADSTGNIRARLEPQKRHLQSERRRIERDVHQRLFKLAHLQDVRALATLVAYAQTRLGDDFALSLYSDAALTFGVFSRARKNPLHVAARLGNTRALALLVAAGFEINSLDKVQRLRFSTGDLFWHFARLVIAQPRHNVEDAERTSLFKATLVTPLHCAVATGQIHAVRWLLARGADPNVAAASSYWSERTPPLFVAENPEIVALLLDAGANLLEVPDPGRMNTLTALQVAYLRGNIPVARVLECSGGDVALTPLHEAAARNDCAIVSKLLRKGADPNCVGENGYVGLYRRTPLHWAAVSGACDTLELLLAAGADPNFQDAHGRTPLHWAATVTRPAVVQMLLAHGADPQLRDLDDMTPLLCASVAKDTSESLVDCLVRYGASIHEHLANGDTGLHLAMKRELETTALALLAAGGDIMRTNNDGYRPVDCTTSTTLQFAVKRAAGTRDVMISYTHSHASFARVLRQSFEAANVTTWLDVMDPSGIGGGAVWREAIARGIQNAAIVVCVLTEDYALSEWCLKELALAKQTGTPIIAVSTEGAVVSDELQVYLYTRQIVPFEPAIAAIDKTDLRAITYAYNAAQYELQFRLLLDGVRDEIEKQRIEHVARGRGRQRRLRQQQHNQQQHIETTAAATAADDWDAATRGALDFVFIAHGEQHARFAQRIRDRLADSNVLCVVDGTQPATDVSNRISAAKEAIRHCAAFVVVLSRATAASERVKDQLAFAEDRGKPIVPILLNDMEIGLDQHYTLARSALFHFTPELGFNASFTQLLACVQQHMPLSGLDGLGRLGGGASASSSATTVSGGQNDNGSFFVVGQDAMTTEVVERMRPPHALTRSNTAPLATAVDMLRIARGANR